MAELLVMAKASGGSGPGKYEKGDVVTIQGDGHKWSAAEQNGGLFTIIKIPGVRRKEIRSYISADKDGDRVLVKRRSVRLKAAVVDGRSQTLTKAALTAAMESR